MASSPFTRSSRFHPWLFLALLVAVCAAAAFAFFFPLPLQRREPESGIAASPRLGTVTAISASSAPFVPTPCSSTRRSKTQAVLIEAVIAESGRVESACVVWSVSPALDRAALEAVKKQSYTPGVVEGKPAKQFLTVTVLLHPKL